MSLTVFINTEKFTEVLAETTLAMVAKEIETRAVSKVRVDTSDLKNTIQSKPLGKYEWITFSQSGHGKAQEYGLAAFGKPNYGFTPYMRPSTKETEANLNTIKKKAEKVAKRKSTVNKKI